MQAFKDFAENCNWIFKLHFPDMRVTRNLLGDIYDFYWGYEKISLKYNDLVVYTVLNGRGFGDVATRALPQNPGDFGAWFTLIPLLFPWQIFGFLPETLTRDTPNDRNYFLVSLRRLFTSVAILRNLPPCDLNPLMYLFIQTGSNTPIWRLLNLCFMYKKAIGIADYFDEKAIAVPIDENVTAIPLTNPETQDIKMSGKDAQVMNATGARLLMEAQLKEEEAKEAERKEKEKIQNQLDDALFDSAVLLCMQEKFLASFYGRSKWLTTPITNPRVAERIRFHFNLANGDRRLWNNSSLVYWEVPFQSK